MGAQRLSLNFATIGRSTLPEAVAAAVGADYGAVGVWRESVQALGVPAAARLLRDEGLRVSTLCRGGFFTAIEGDDRRAALDDNRRAIEEAATLGAGVLVLVAGGLPTGSHDLAGARTRVAEALHELGPYAAEAGVTLGLEPLHPVFAADRCVVSTLGQALDMVAPFEPSVAGVVVDTSHVWWDPSLDEQVIRAGRAGRIASYQVADWVTPLLADTLMSRGMPGDGWVDIPGITRAVLTAGYTGDIEYEIFREEVWSRPPLEVARDIAERHQRLVAPALETTW